MELAKWVLEATTRRERTVAQYQESTNIATNNEENTAQNVAKKLKDGEKKVSGDLAQY